FLFACHPVVRAASSREGNAPEQVFQTCGAAEPPSQIESARMVGRPLSARLEAARTTEGNFQGRSTY
ncbi:MAG: hypothetical protein ABFE07_05850, partial [Armatimonadia bacterium]